MGISNEGSLKVFGIQCFYTDVLQDIRDLHKKLSFYGVFLLFSNFILSHNVAQRISFIEYRNALMHTYNANITVT